MKYEYEIKRIKTEYGLIDFLNINFNKNKTNKNIMRGKILKKKRESVTVSGGLSIHL